MSHSALCWLGLTSFGGGFENDFFPLNGPPIHSAIAAVLAYRLCSGVVLQ